MIREAFVNKARWLYHEDLLLKRPLKEQIVDIKLTYGPALTNCKCENNTNGHWFNNWAKCFYIVPIIMLVKPFGN